MNRETRPPMRPHTQNHYMFWTGPKDGGVSGPSKITKAHRMQARVAGEQAMICRADKLASAQEEQTQSGHKVLARSSFLGMARVL